VDESNHWKFEGEPAAWSIASHVGFMKRTLKLGRGGKVLDLGCGLGCHSIELADRGYDVTALEWSKPYLDVARQRADEAGVSVRFLQGDMTCMSFDSEFDAVVFWGNTFGMFSDEENAQTLQGIAPSTLLREIKSPGIAVRERDGRSKESQ